VAQWQLLFQWFGKDLWLEINAVPAAIPSVSAVVVFFSFSIAIGELLKMLSIDNWHQTILSGCGRTTAFIPRLQNVQFNETKQDSMWFQFHWPRRCRRLLHILRSLDKVPCIINQIYFSIFQATNDNNEKFVWVYVK